MIGWLLRRLGLRRRRRRIYAQPPLPPALPVRRRHKSEAAMPLPPGYIQASSLAAASPPPPLPRRKFGASSMPLPPGQVQGPPAATTAPPQAAPASPPEHQTSENQTPEPAPARPPRRHPSPASLARKLAHPRRIIRPTAAASPQPPPVESLHLEPAPLEPAPAEHPSARPPAPAAPPRRGSPGRTAWRRWFAAGIRPALLYGLPALAVLVVAALEVRDMRHTGVVVMPVTVPAAIAASGRTPEVLAAHLVDQIELARRLTLADRAHRPEGSLPPAPRIALPSPLLSRRGIASRLRDLLASPVQRVTADVVQQPDGKLSLRLRMTGAGEIASQSGIGADQIDGALRYLAPEVWRIAEPVLYAWYKSEMEPRPQVVTSALRSLLADAEGGPAPLDERARRTITVLLARAQAESGDPQAALASLDGLGEPARSDPAAWAVRAMALLTLDRAAEAVEAERRVLALAPGSAWAHLSAARFDLSVSRFAEAAQEARAARKLAPDNGAALMVESAALLALRRVPEAVQAARDAIRLTPWQPGVQEALGNALLASERPDLALGLYDAELKLHPGRVASLLGRARALQTLGRQAEALSATEAALQISPSNGTALLLRSWSLLALKRPADALAGFEALLHSRPDMPPLLQGKAAALTDLGRTAEALVALKRLAVLVPNNPKLQAEIERLQGQAK